MNSLEWETIEEIIIKLANRVKNIRKRKKITQQKLASMSGVSFGSIKRFELTGQISLESLTKIARALGCLDEIRNLFTQVKYLSIEEIINERKK